MISWLVQRLRRDVSYRAERESESELSVGAGLDQSAETASTDEVRCLTLNVWGLYALPHVEYRVEAVADILSGYDIVCLQEVWHCRERDFLRAAGSAAGLGFAHYFAVGVGIPCYPGSHGTGLLVLSRLAILDVLWKRYSVNGKPYKLQHSDYLTGRGIGLLRVAGDIDVYTTHMHACYSDHGAHDEYLAHRVAQAFEAAQFVRATTRGKLVLLAGDFNTQPDSLAMAMLLRLAGLRDAYQATATAPGHTYGTADNVWSHRPNHASQRLDYILHAGDASAWDLTDCSVVRDFIEEPHPPRRRLPLSDHWGVQARFRRRSSSPPSSSPPSVAFPAAWPPRHLGGADLRLLQELLQQAEVVCRRGTIEATTRRRRHNQRACVVVCVCAGIAAFRITLPWPLSSAMYLVSAYLFTELLLSQGVVTDEIMSFREVVSQLMHLRHHLDNLL